MVHVGDAAVVSSNLSRNTNVALRCHERRGQEKRTLIAAL